jgi:hypothetical protein
MSVTAQPRCGPFHTGIIDKRPSAHTVWNSASATLKHEHFFGLDFGNLRVQTGMPMEHPTREIIRNEERRALLEEWGQRLYPHFLEMGLDFRRFSQRWDGDENTRQAVSDVKLITEMVVTTMHTASFNARAESLEALADDE